MRAAEELAKRQRESPLGPDGDRVLQLFKSLPRLNDAEFEQVRSSSKLAAGEMNFRLPNAKTFHYPDGSHLITIYTGLLDFYASVCKILMGATNLYTNGEVIEAHSMGDCVSELEALFRRWTPKGIEADQPSELKQSELPAAKAENAAYLLEGASRFVLCHELGHVLYYGTKQSGTDAAGLTKEQELASDIAGMKTAVTSAPSAGFGRVNLAGCVLSLRVLAVFAAMGHPFTGDHPAPLSRLENLFQALKEWCATPGDYWWISTIAYAYDEQLETAGQRALGGADVLPVRADRAFSRMSAAIEEVLKGRQERTLIVPLMAREFEEAPPEMLREIAGYAAEMFSEQPALENAATQKWAEKGEVFRSLYHEWPKRVSEAFDQAFAAQRQVGA